MDQASLPSYQETNQVYNGYLLDIHTLTTSVKNKKGAYVELDENTFFDVSLLSENFEILHSVIYIKSVIESFPSVYFGFEYKEYNSPETYEDRIQRLESENRKMKEKILTQEEMIKYLSLSQEEGPKDISLSENTQIILTPISKGYKKKPPCSKKDYEEQQSRVKNGNPLMWDDTCGNKSKVGDIFIFVHNRVKLEIHFITKIIPANSRLVIWNRNKGHEKRNVILLTDEPIIVSFDEVKSLKYDTRGSVVLRNTDVKSEIISIIKQKQTKNQ